MPLHVRPDGGSPGLGVAQVELRCPARLCALGDGAGRTIRAVTPGGCCTRGSTSTVAASRSRRVGRGQGCCTAGCRQRAVIHCTQAVVHVAIGGTMRDGAAVVQACACRPVPHGNVGNGKSASQARGAAWPVPRQTVPAACQHFIFRLLFMERCRWRVGAGVVGDSGRRHHFWARFAAQLCRPQLPSFRTAEPQPPRKAAGLPLSRPRAHAEAQNVCHSRSCTSTRASCRPRQSFALRRREPSFLCRVNAVRSDTQ